MEEESRKVVRNAWEGSDEEEEELDEPELEADIHLDAQYTMQDNNNNNTVCPSTRSSDLKMYNLLTLCCETKTRSHRTPL